MPTFTKTVHTDTGEDLTITRTTTEPGEAATLRASGWLLAATPDDGAQRGPQDPQAPAREPEVQVRAIVAGSEPPAGK